MGTGSWRPLSSGTLGAVEEVGCRPGRFRRTVVDRGGIWMAVPSFDGRSTSTSCVSGRSDAQPAWIRPPMRSPRHVQLLGRHHQPATVFVTVCATRALKGRSVSEAAADLSRGGSVVMKSGLTLWRERRSPWCGLSGS